MKLDLDHVISANVAARAALQALDNLPEHSRRTLFVTNDNGILVGTLTDGDIRRGLLNGLEISEGVTSFIKKTYRFLEKGEDSIEKIKAFKNSDIYLVPVVDQDKKLIEILDLLKTSTLLPLTALIMAGGRGERLKPLTDGTPKPMLQVGGKPIIEHNIDRLISFGISEVFISVKYLKEQIMDYFGDGSKKELASNTLRKQNP